MSICTIFQCKNADTPLNRCHDYLSELKVVSFHVHLVLFSHLCRGWVCNQHLLILLNQLNDWCWLNRFVTPLQKPNDKSGQGGVVLIPITAVFVINWYCCGTYCKLLGITVQMTSFSTLWGLFSFHLFISPSKNVNLISTWTIITSASIWFQLGRLSHHPPEIHLMDRRCHSEE